MKIRIKETFEYDIELPDNLNDTQIIKKIWRIRDTLDCVADMPTPFWDGYPCPEMISESMTWKKVEDPSL